MTHYWRYINVNFPISWPQRSHIGTGGVHQVLISCFMAWLVAEIFHNYSLTMVYDATNYCHLLSILFCKL